MAMSMLMLIAALIRSNPQHSLRTRASAITHHWPRLRCPPIRVKRSGPRLRVQRTRPIIGSDRDMLLDESLQAVARSVQTGAMRTCKKISDGCHAHARHLFFDFDLVIIDHDNAKMQSTTPTRLSRRVLPAFNSCLELAIDKRIRSMVRFLCSAKDCAVTA